MAGMDRAIRILDDDAVDGQVNVGCFADGKLVAEGRLGDFLNLGERIAARDPFGIAMGLGHEALVKFCGRNYLKKGFFQVEAIVVARSGRSVACDGSPRSRNLKRHYRRAGL